MRTSRHTTCWKLTGLLLTTALLSACATSPRGAPSELYDGFDTYSAGKLRHAASLQGAAGSVASSATRAAASKVAQLAPGILLFFAHDEERLNELERRLVECAQIAEQEVNNEYFGGRPPRPEEYREQIGVDECGNPITRRMQLGQAKHKSSPRKQLHLPHLLALADQLKPFIRDENIGLTSLLDKENMGRWLRRLCQ